MVKGVFGGKERGRKVVIAVADKDSQVAYFWSSHRGASRQHLNIDCRRHNSRAGHWSRILYSLIFCPFEFRIDIMVEGGSKGAKNGFGAGVIFDPFADCIGINSFKAAVKTSNCPPLIA